MASAVEQIRAVDRQIDAIRRDLVKRHPVQDQLCAASWQAAWDAHPELFNASQALWRERGTLQLERDRFASEQAAAKARRDARRRLPAKCPSCKGSGYAFRRAA